MTWDDGHFKHKHLSYTSLLTPDELWMYVSICLWSLLVLGRLQYKVWRVAIETALKCCYSPEVATAYSSHLSQWLADELRSIVVLLLW